ncbi:hypothetical protein JZ751_021677, partial [Albula glossodonta]
MGGNESNITPPPSTHPSPLTSPPAFNPPPVLLVPPLPDSAPFRSQLLDSALEGRWPPQLFFLTWQ